MKKFILAWLLVTAAAGCEKSRTPLPECVEEKILDFQSMEKKNPAAEIWEYDYHGQKVYFISEYCCDIPSLVIDAHCNTVCSPSGGLAGTGDGNCSRFFEEAKSGKQIWKDNR